MPVMPFNDIVDDLDRTLGETLPDLPMTLVKVRDLVSYEGPLLSEFKDAQTDEPYLFHWIDVGLTSHRWLVYPCPKEKIEAFLAKKCRQPHLLPPEHILVYLVDLTGEAEVEWVGRLLLSEVPSHDLWKA